MDFGTIVGWLIGGFATRIYAGAGAAWIALEVVKPLQGAAKSITAVLG